MKIEVEIPDELVREGQNLFIFVGMEHVAVKRPDRPWVVKDQRCSMCGSCCESTHVRGMSLPVKDGKCAFLKPHPTEEFAEKGMRICSWRNNRPFNCCIGSPRMEPKCTVTWKEAE